MDSEIHAGWLSLLPPVLAIILALTTKRVLLALFTGVLVANIVLNLNAVWVSPFTTIDHMVSIASSPNNLQLICFSMLVGGLLKLIKDAQGFEAFALALERFRNNFGKRTIYSLTYFFGVTLFLETWSNVLINGTTMGTLYDRLKVSRVRMAYFNHTIGINAVALILINGWGAFYMGLLSAQNVPRPFEFLLSSVPYILYGWFSLALVAFVMVTGFTIGPMKEFEKQLSRPDETTQDKKQNIEVSTVKPRLQYMVAPILTLMASVLASLYITGHGDITAGEGAKSILYAVSLSIIVIAVLLMVHREFNLVEIEKKVVAGTTEFFGIGILIVLALSLGDLTKTMGTGFFVAQLVQGTIPAMLVPALIFILGAIMSFATGTSYGTFSIMVPVALPLADAMGLNPSLVFGACLAGGLFGDNCSPISDTTIVTSLGADVKIIDHVRTQLPFALIAGFLTIIGYLILAA